MAVNQPIITGNQADDSWRLEVTAQLNNEEARVNALASDIRNIEVPTPVPSNNNTQILTGDNTFTGANTFTGSNTFQGRSIFDGIINSAQPYINVNKTAIQSLTTNREVVTWEGTPEGSGITLSTDNRTFTISSAGLYLINLTVVHNPNDIFISINSTTTNNAGVTSTTNSEVHYRNSIATHRVFMNRYNMNDTIQVTAAELITNEIGVNSHIQIYKLG